MHGRQLFHCEFEAYQESFGQDKANDLLFVFAEMINLLQQYAQGQMILNAIEHNLGSRIELHISHDAKPQPVTLDFLRRFKVYQRSFGQDKANNLLCSLAIVLKSLRQEQGGQQIILDILKNGFKSKFTIRTSYNIDGLIRG